MMKLFEETFSATKPIYYFSLATATVGVIYNEDGNYSKTIFQIVQCFVYVIIVLSLYVLSLLEKFNLFPSLQTSGIISFIRNLYAHGINLTTACALLVCQVNAKKYITISNGIVEIDNRFKKLGLRNSLLHSNYMLWKYHTVLMLIISELYLLTIIIISMVFEKYAKYQLIAFIITFEINSCIELQYFSWTSTIKERFKILNQLLKVKIDESMLTEKYPVNESLFADEIDVIKEEHKRLTKIARSINTYYSLFLLMYTGLNFIVFITEAYSFIYIITFSNYIDEGSQYLLFNSLQLLICATFQLFCIVRYTTLMCYEANYTKELLHGIRIHPEKVDSRNLVRVSILLNMTSSFATYSSSVLRLSMDHYYKINVEPGRLMFREMFLITSRISIIWVKKFCAVISTSLHLMHDKLEISACRLFNVDFSLLHSICAAVTIYLVIMLQFDIDAKKKLIESEKAKQMNSL